MLLVPIPARKSIAKFIEILIQVFSVVVFPLKSAFDRINLLIFRVSHTVASKSPRQLCANK